MRQISYDVVIIAGQSATHIGAPFMSEFLALSILPSSKVSRTPEPVPRQLSKILGVESRIYYLSPHGSRRLLHEHPWSKIGES
jgi:hypothetical protein